LSGTARDAVSLEPDYNAEVDAVVDFD